MCDLSLYQKVLDRLGKHKIGRSCLHVKKLADVENEVLHELIETHCNDQATE